MFDDFDHGGGHDGDHDGDHGGGGVDDGDVLVARRPKQQCGSDDSSSTSGLPESHFPPFSSTMYLLTFPSVFFFHISSLCTLAKRILTSFICRIISKRILIVFKLFFIIGLKTIYWLSIHSLQSISSLSTSWIATTFTMIRLHLNGTAQHQYLLLHNIFHFSSYWCHNNLLSLSLDIFILFQFQLLPL